MEGGKDVTGLVTALPHRAGEVTCPPVVGLRETGCREAPRFLRPPRSPPSSHTRKNPPSGSSNLPAAAWVGKAAASSSKSRLGNQGKLDSVRDCRVRPGRVKAGDMDSDRVTEPHHTGIERQGGADNITKLDL